MNQEELAYIAITLKEILDNNNDIRKNGEAKLN